MPRLWISTTTPAYHLVLSRACVGAVLFALVSLFAATPAAAAHRPVAVLRVQFQGDMPENAKGFLSERLILGLAAADFQVFAGLVVTQSLKKGGLETCREASCYQEIAQRLGVEYLVTGVVQVEKKNYTVTFDLISGRDGKAIGQSRKQCELCGVGEVGQRMDKQMVELRQYAETAAASAPARVLIESVPSGASVTVDGAPAGVTPTAVDVAAGSHRFSVVTDGFHAYSRSISVESATNGFVSVDLSPVAGSHTAGWHPARWLAATTLAVGAAAVVGGLIGLKYNGKVVGCYMPKSSKPIDNCLEEQQLTTNLESGIAIGAGAVLMAAGGAMFYLGSVENAPAPPATSSSANPGHRAWLLNARGAF